MIRLTDVRLDEHALALVEEVLRSGQLAQDRMVAAFEQGFSATAGTEHAVATSSGTTALVTALQALDLQPDDEVIIPALTFVATLNAVLESGATARIVDIRSDDMTIDVARVSEAIGPRTRVLLPVHLFGCPADLPALEALAQPRGLRIVEDAAQAPGAAVQGRQVGSWGVGAFSFYATKNITTGEGGMVTTSDGVIADRARVLRNQGMRARYEYEGIGHNFRMTEMQAALGLAQLEHLDEWNDRRIENAGRISDALGPVKDLVLPITPKGRRHVFHQYSIRVKDSSPVSRDSCASALREHGVETGVYYPKLVHEYPCFQGNSRVVVDDVPAASAVTRQILSLPIHQWLEPRHLDHIAEATCLVMAG